MHRHSGTHSWSGDFDAAVTASGGKQVARINIEDDFWVDIGAVAAAIGDEDRAIGMVVRFLRLAQSKFKQNEAISDKEFKDKNFSESLIGRFADRTECGIVAIGARKHFSWLSSRKESGKRGGKQTQAKRSKRKQVQPSSSSSSSSSSSNSSRIAISEKSPGEINPISFYCDLWKSRNGKSPDIRGKEAGQITKLAKDLGIKRACQIMSAYFSMPDPFFVKRGYDVGTMLSSLAAIQQFEANGKIVTKKVVEHFEEAVDKAQGTNRRPRRKIEDLERERAEMLAEAQAPKMLGGKT